MKLFNSSNFKDSMDIYLRRMGRTLSMPASNLYRKVKTLVQPSSIARRATNDVMQEVKSLKKPPQTLKAYVLIGEHYIAKRLLFILLLLAIVLPALFINYAYPVIEQKFLVNTMPIDSDEIPGYTGKVRLIDRNTGTLLFAGRLDNGRINGEGTLYDTSGNLIYTGNFQMDAFDGFGELYYANGTMQYMGNFSMNAYEGSGSLFYKSGGKKYVGNFAAGVYEGKGTRYYGNGQKMYEGEFANGVYEGEGDLYDMDGALVYSGEFAKSVFSDTGILYKDGEKCYEGGFVEGYYNGTGTLYKNGEVVYQGEFDNVAPDITFNYDENGMIDLTQEEIINGFTGGDITLSYEDGTIHYEGDMKTENIPVKENFMTKKEIWFMMAILKMV